MLFGALLEHNNIWIAVETVLDIDSNKGLILKTITNELELIDQKIHKNQLDWNKYGKRAKAGLGGLYLSPYFACFDFCQSFTQKHKKYTLCSDVTIH